MNRMVVVLLFVLIMLVAMGGLLIWRSGEPAHEVAARVACIPRTEATAIIGLNGAGAGRAGGADRPKESIVVDQIAQRSAR